MISHTIRARAARGDADLDPVDDREQLQPFLEDAAHVPGGHAVAMFTPRSEQGVARLLTTSARVLPIGAQSSLTGGATPRGDVLLSTAHLRTREDIGADRLRVGAGVTLADIDAHLRARGALYPPRPTWQGATIGGAIATNAAGAATFKYGTTRQWIEALTVVLASGDVLDIRRGETVASRDGWFEMVLARGTVRVPVPTYTMPDVPKVSAGYFAAPGMDLIDLFIGAEGTLGVVTDATLRVLDSRPATCLAFVTFRQREPALAFVARVRQHSEQTWLCDDPDGLDVSAIEHMDRRSLDLVREDGVAARLGITLDPEAAIGLLIALDLPAGSTSADAYAAFGSAVDGDPVPLATPGGMGGLSRFADMLHEYDVLGDTLVAAPGDTAGTERLLALREAVPVAVNQRVGRAQRDVDPRIEKTAADVIVPFSRVGEMLALYDATLAARGLDGAIWGHISDGNVHPNVIPRSFADVVAGREAVLAFGRAAIRMGGSPLAEHGVGRSATKQQLLRDLYGEAGIEQMRAVKQALDPKGVLASGVIFSAR